MSKYNTAGKFSVEKFRRFTGLKNTFQAMIVMFKNAELVKKSCALRSISDHDKL